jgi:hypothetical protein
MSLFNVGILAKNTGDYSGDNRNNSQFIVTENGGRRTKNNGGHHGHGKSGKGRRHRNCD